MHTTQPGPWDTKTAGTTGCIILAGGFSARMRSPKALLPYDAHHNFVQHLVHTYVEAGITSIVVVNNHTVHLGAIGTGHVHTIVVDNLYPEKGRLYSLQLGIAHMPSVSWSFVQPVDSPFVSVELIRLLLACRRQADYLSPVHNNQGGHPILISRRIMDDLGTVADYDLTLKELLAPYSRHRLETDSEECLININAPEDYIKYFGLKNVRLAGPI